jgi:hypothetical protein
VAQDRAITATIPVCDSGHREIRVIGAMGSQLTPGRRSTAGGRQMSENARPLAFLPYEHVGTPLVGVNTPTLVVRDAGDA